MTEATTGRASRDNPALADEWAMAAQMNESFPGPGEWVPWKAILVDHAINPREKARLDYDHVREYADVFYDLPPIQVQRDTFVLVDGNHRYRATAETAVSSVAIRILEMDIPDDRLREAAFRANAEHGIQLTTRERAAHLRYLLEKYGNGWDDPAYAKACGLSVLTVRDHRRKASISRQHGGITTPIEPGAQPESDSDVVTTTSEAHSDFVGNVQGGKSAGYFKRGDHVLDLGTGEIWEIQSKDLYAVEMVNAAGTRTATAGLTSPQRFQSVDSPDARHDAKGPDGNQSADADAVALSYVADGRTAPQRDDPAWLEPDGLARIEAAVFMLADAAQAVEAESVVQAFGRARMTYLAEGLGVATNWLSAVLDIGDLA